MTKVYPYLILAGTSILAATAWLLREYRKQVLHNRELIRLNESVTYDLPDFLRQCWLPLQHGGFSGFVWELDWFGTRLSGQQGDCKGNQINQQLNVKEIALSIQLYTRQRSWERRWFTSTLAENFFLLLRMNMWIKLGSVQGAFEQSARMAVFLQHDVKNLVQLIGLASDQISHPLPGHEQQLLGALQTTLPAVRDRAEQLLDNLRGTAPSEDGEELELKHLIQDTAALYELPVTINGSARCRLDPGHLQGIFDNLLSNYARQIHKHAPRNTDIQVHITRQSNWIDVSISDRHATPFPSSERLFEPFWSEQGAGRGIGLYQARQQAQNLGGKLSASTDSQQPLSFHLQLPDRLADSLPGSSKESL